MIKKLLKYLESDSWEDIGDHLFNIGKLIGRFVLYISKAYLLMTITCVVIFTVWPLVVYLSNPVDFKGSLWESIAVCVFYMGIIGPVLNIRAFLVLFFIDSIRWKLSLKLVRFY